MGAVYKRATKKGTVRWLGRYRDEDSREHSKSFNTRKEASAWVALMETGGAPGQNTSNTVTVGEVWGSWSVREELSPGSKRVYAWERQNLKPLESLTINQITGNVLDNLYKELTTGRSWVSPTDTGISREQARTTLGRLRSAVAYYSSSSSSMTMPESLSSWRPPKAHVGSRVRVDPGSLPTLSTLRAVGNVLKYGAKITPIAPGIRPSPSLADMLQVCAVTGLRIGELVGLDVLSIDHGGNRIRVSHQLTASSLTPTTLKTPSSMRTVPVPYGASPILMTLVEEAKERPIPEGWESPPLFLNQRGDPWRPSGALYALKKAQWNYHTTGRKGRRYSSLEDIPVFGWHSIRHLYASTLIREGRPITEVAAVMGHSSPAITAEIYAHALRGYEESVRASASSLVFERTIQDHEDTYGNNDDYGVTH